MYTKFIIIKKVGIVSFFCKGDLLMKFLTLIAHFFAAIGAINWGLVAFVKFNLVEYICQFVPYADLDKIIYGVVAAAGLWTIVTLFKC